MQSSKAPFLGLVHLLTGMLFIGISVPLILERVKPNSVYGVRIAKAFESEANWYAINLVGGRWLAGAGAVVMVIGILALFKPPTTQRAFIILIFAPLALVLLTLIPILAYAGRLP